MKLTFYYFQGVGRNHFQPAKKYKLMLKNKYIHLLGGRGRSVCSRHKTGHLPATLCYWYLPQFLIYKRAKSMNKLTRLGDRPERDEACVKVLHVVGALHVVVYVSLTCAAKCLNGIELILLEVNQQVIIKKQHFFIQYKKPSHRSSQWSNIQQTEYMLELKFANYSLLAKIKSRIKLD